MKDARRSLRRGCWLLALTLLTGCQAKDENTRPPQQRFDPRVPAIEDRIQSFARGVATYKADVGNYPQKLEELFVSDAKGWKGPYAGSAPSSAPGAPKYGAEQHLTDGWGNRLKYAFHAESPKILSLGPDGKEGTDDDIAVKVPSSK